jgi:signal transduction histidine kinase
MTVLIISDDGAFARDVMGRWQAERIVPAFTVVSSTVWQGADGGFDLAILGPLPMARLTPVLRMLESSSSAPVLYVTEEADGMQTLREGFPRLSVLRQYEGWLEATVMLGQEMLRRVEAQARARVAEESAAASNRYATLGQYMLDMRHNFNNALTSVLGHAELLLLEPAAFSNEVRDQIETLRSMALRMHEIMQRFSSLDAEMRFVERASQAETRVGNLGFGTSV